MDARNRQVADIICTRHSISQGNRTSYVTVSKGMTVLRHDNYIATHRKYRKTSIQRSSDELNSYESVVFLETLKGVEAMKEN